MQLFLPTLHAGNYIVHRVKGREGEGSHYFKWIEQERGCSGLKSKTD